MIQKLLTDTASLDRPQALGLCALICIASREKTSVAYQMKEWGFSDIPQAFISATDELDDDGQMVLLSMISDGFVQEDALESLV